MSRSQRAEARAVAVTSLVKRLLLGRPLATDEQAGQRVPKLVALPTFSADAISSTAYATEEILIVVAAGGSSLALGSAKLVPISLVVAARLVVVVGSYRQTIFAYPGGGGSCIVSGENLGRYASLVAAAALLIDYVLTVAVSVSAGVAAIVSLPALRAWRRNASCSAWSLSPSPCSSSAPRHEPVERHRDAGDHFQQSNLLSVSNADRRTVPNSLRPSNAFAELVAWLSPRRLTAVAGGSTLAGVG